MMKKTAILILTLVLLYSVLLADPVEPSNETDASFPKLSFSRLWHQ